MLLNIVDSVMFTATYHRSLQIEEKLWAQRRKSNEAPLPLGLQMTSAAQEESAIAPVQPVSPLVHPNTLSHVNDKLASYRLDEDELVENQVAASSGCESLPLCCDSSTLTLFLGAQIVRWPWSFKAYTNRFKIVLIYVTNICELHVKDWAMIHAIMTMSSMASTKIYRMLMAFDPMLTTQPVRSPRGNLNHGQYIHHLHHRTGNTRIRIRLQR